MFISASGPIQPEFFLLTLGHTCRYLIQHDGRFSLFDVGASVHIPSLLARLKALGLSPENLEYIFVSHAHADRVGGIPLLKKAAPQAKICGTSRLRDALRSDEVRTALASDDRRIAELFPHSKGIVTFEKTHQINIDKVVVEGDAIQLTSDIAVRAISTPGHSEESTAYYIQPYNILVADETLGYYQGARPPSPGADASVTKMREVVKKLSDHEISALCLPDSGVLTGSLIQKHLRNLLQTMDKIVSTYRNEIAGGLTHEEVEPIIREVFYISESADPIVLSNLAQSGEAVVRQVPGLTS